MKVTYDKSKVEPKYKLGDEFTSTEHNGKLIQIDYNKIALLITSGNDESCVWTWGVNVDDVRKLKDSEVCEALGTTTNFKLVNPRKPKSTKINIEVSEDELKILWTRVNKGRMVSDDEVMIGDIGRFSDIKYDMWKTIDDACVGLGLKGEYGKFKE